MKKAFKIIIINFSIFCTLIVSVEILCQLAYLVKNGNILFLEVVNERYSQSQVFERHPYLAGRPKASVVVQENNKTIKTTEYHTRWTGGNSDDNNLIRVAVLGGSTTFGNGVTDEDSWPALLQSILGKGFSVINYGVPGYSTAENIIQMSLIIPEKRPHVVIFYEGWNDIRNYHEKELGEDYYGHGMRQYESLSIPIRNAYATVWLINKIKNKITKSKANNIELFVTPDPFVDRIYLRNLKTLKLLVEKNNALSVFIPQVLNYSYFLGIKGSHEWTRHIMDDAMPTLMERFNSHMKGLCSQSEEKCIVLNEVTKEKWLPNDFVDDGHFSKSGGMKFAKIIAKMIRRKHESGMFEKSEQKRHPPD